MSKILTKILTRVFSKNNTTTKVEERSSSKDNLKNIYNDIVINNIKYSVKDLDKLFPVLEIKPTSTVEEIMFNAGQRSVIKFLLSKEGK